MTVPKVNIDVQSAMVSPKKKIDAPLESKCIKTIRCLSADMVQAANSGHPGAPMGCAAMAHTLFGHVMNYNPSNPSWWNRDRFVLSNGHACALLYSMLHLTGYPGLTIDQLKAFRKLGSITPGHPEAGMTPGVEVSTGPLGQGISNSVGLAIAQEMLAATYSPDLFTNFTYVICGDGCLQEGVSYEACAVAGHLGLGRLIVLYDDNQITIDGSTDLSFTENVRQRFEAQNWQVLEVADGTNDVESILQAVNTAKQNLNQPTLIKVRTVIGIDSALAGTEKVHGSPLGPEQIKKLKTLYGFNPEESFAVSEDVKQFYQNNRGSDLEKQWNDKLEKFCTANPDKGAELKARLAFSSDAELLALMPKFDDGKSKATRQFSGEVLAVLAKAIPALVGGSADLTESTVTNKANLAAFTRTDRANKFIHFGVREHAMAAICNGLAAFGGFVPFCATFANFIGYCWGAARLSALSHHKVLYIATHDSIDLGEDGPTHQPIEMLPLLRGTPNMQTIRPADGKETVGAYLAHFRSVNKGPTVMMLSRGAVPPLEGSAPEKVLFGAYVLESAANAKLILAGSGTEVTLLVASKKLLQAKGIDATVVSFPSWSLFETQSDAYKQSVFPNGTPVLYVEAANCLGAEKWAKSVIGMTTFGASAPANSLKAHFGFTPENIAAKAAAML